MAVLSDFLASVLPYPKVVFISTATNGTLDTSDLLCLSYVTLEDGDSGTQDCGLLARKVSRDALLVNQAYHHVSQDIIDRYGVDDDTYIDRLSTLFAKASVFSYNPGFQKMVLGCVLGDRVPMIYNLPLLCKGLEVCSVSSLSDVVTLEALEDRLLKIVKPIPSFRNLCTARGISSNAADFGVLPCVENADKLKSLWDFLCALPIPA